MSLSALVFLAVYFGGLGLAFFRPIFGLMAYLWAFYNYPDQRWWGADLPELRWSLAAAAVTLLAERMHALNAANQRRGALYLYADSSNASPSQSPWPPGGLMWLTAFAVWLWIQTPWALNADWHFEGSMLFTKYVVLCFLLVRLLHDRHTAELFGWGHVAGCFIWGWMAWAANVQGRMEMALGPGLEDANGVGFHLGTGVAFAGLLLFGSRHKLRWLALPAIPFILNGVILTASRGAMLGLVAGGVAALLLGPRRRRAITLAGAGAGAALFLMLAGSEVFWERMATLRPEQGEEIEASAASRVAIADANWQMFLDHPFGVGHRGNILLSPEYIAETYLSPDVNQRAAHNTMLAVIVDHGLPGAILYLGLHLWAAFKLWRLKRFDRDGLPPELGALRAATGATLAALVVCGLFSNYIKAEVGIWSFALVTVLDRLALQWQLSATSEPARATAPTTSAASHRPVSAPRGSERPAAGRGASLAAR